MNEPNQARTVLVCDQQPLAIEGIRSLLERSPGIRFAGGITSLAGGMELAHTLKPDLLLLDRSFGDAGVSKVLAYLRPCSSVSVVVWGHRIGEPGALRILRCGAKGVLSKTANPASVIGCIRAVCEGRTWMEEEIGSTCKVPGNRLLTRAAQRRVLKTKHVARRVLQGTV